MQRAEYTMTKDKDISELKHSALNFDLYTHFTSPIRRYPDLVVHRQLKYILNKMGMLDVKNDNQKDYIEISQDNKEDKQIKETSENIKNQFLIINKDNSNNEVAIIDLQKINKQEINENVQEKKKMDKVQIIQIEQKQNIDDTADILYNKMICNVIKKMKEDDIMSSEININYGKVIEEKTEVIISEEITDAKEYENVGIVNYEKYVDLFNEKYYNGKMISSKCQKLFQCIFLKNTPNETYKALIVDISNKIPMKNKKLPQQNSFDSQTLVISLFIPKLNLELDWKKDDNNNIINYKFNSETSVSIDYKDEEDQNIFEEIKVNVIPIDTIPIDIKCTISFS